MNGGQSPLGQYDTLQRLRPFFLSLALKSVPTRFPLIELGKTIVAFPLPRPCFCVRLVPLETDSAVKPGRLASSISISGSVVKCVSPLS